MAMAATNTTATAYRELLESLKEHIRWAKLPSAISLDPEFLLFTWDIGQTIITHRARLGWHDRLASEISKDLRRAFPLLTGFSARSLKEMVAFAERWPKREIVQQLVAQMPWDHDVDSVEAEPTR